MELYLLNFSPYYISSLQYPLMVSLLPGLPNVSFIWTFSIFFNRIPQPHTQTLLDHKICFLLNNSTWLSSRKFKVIKTFTIWGMFRKFMKMSIMKILCTNFKFIVTQMNWTFIIFQLVYLFEKQKEIEGSFFSSISRYVCPPNNTDLSIDLNKTKLLLMFFTVSE